MQYQAKDLFQVQSELVEAKVDMAASKAIDRVLHRIDELQNDMDTRFTALGRQDMVAVKTRLGMTQETRSIIRAKWIDYLFRTGWIVLATIVASISTYVAMHIHALI